MWDFLCAAQTGQRAMLLAGTLRTQPDPHSKLLCEGLVADNDLIQPKLMGALGYFTFSKHVKAKLNF